jgi:hypothetical protein
MSRKLIALCVILVLGLAAISYAQRRGRRGGMEYVKRPEHITWNSDFTFCRIAFRQAYDGDGGGWGVDYPRADINLPIRLSELTKTPVNLDGQREPNHVVIMANEEELFKCPFVMITEVGATSFTDEEAQALRRYFQKGGFMWADDCSTRSGSRRFRRSAGSTAAPRPSAGPTARRRTRGRSSIAAAASWYSFPTTAISAIRTNVKPTTRRTSTIFQWKATPSGSTCCCTR